MQHKHLTHQSQCPIADNIDLYTAGGNSVHFVLNGACMKTPLINTFTDHFDGGKYTFQCTKWSELTLLHSQTLSATNTHMQTSTHASHDVNVNVVPIII